MPAHRKKPSRETGHRLTLLHITLSLYYPISILPDIHTTILPCIHITLLHITLSLYYPVSILPGIHTTPYPYHPAPYYPVSIFPLYHTPYPVSISPVSILPSLYYPCITQLTMYPYHPSPYYPVSISPISILPSLYITLVSHQLSPLHDIQFCLRALPLSPISTSLYHPCSSRT